MLKQEKSKITIGKFNDNNEITSLENVSNDNGKNLEEKLVFKEQNGEFLIKFTYVDKERNKKNLHI